MKFTGLCLKCGKPTGQHRQGLCSRCYQLDYHGRTLGDECEVCGFGDLRMLVRRKMSAEEMHTLCGNCAVLLGRRKMNVDDLRAERFPPTDRRNEDRRKNPVRRKHSRREEIDQRLEDRGAPDRRTDERRD